MKGFRLNPDKEHVMKIINGTLKKNGFCPCQVQQDDTALCPCDKLLKEENCCCKLFIKVEE